MCMSKLSSLSDGFTKQHRKVSVPLLHSSPREAASTTLYETPQVWCAQAVIQQRRVFGNTCEFKVQYLKNLPNKELNSYNYNTRIM